MKSLVLFITVLGIILPGERVDGLTQRGSGTIDARLNQLDADVGLMKLTLAGYSSIVSQLQNDLKAKDNSIGTLTQEISSLKQKVAFMAELDGNYIHPTEGRHIVYKRVHLNDGNAYHSSHGTFTAPIKGLYEFSIGVTAKNAADTRTHTNIMKNGVSIGYLFFDGLSMGSPWLKETESILTHLNVGDEVWVQITQSLGSSVELAAGSMHTYFSGYLIKPDL